MDDDASNDKGLPWPGADANRAKRGSDAPQIPDHQLFRIIGGGSYGDVWLARSTMGVYRAVKIVYKKSFADPRPFQRELTGIRKFEPISRSHEGFIDILHVGLNEERGYFYYVMELGDDAHSGTKIDPEQYAAKTLANHLSSCGSLPYPSCVQLGLDLSRALIELHRNGLVHRDIKPSNIIFVNNVPKLADIGLVASTEETLSYVGTEGFIPPEGPGTTQADVYALGKVLYEAFTGRDRHDFPELPEEWGQRPDHRQCLELNEVILHACRSGGNRRYQTAEEMHADLVVLLHGQSVRRLKALERSFSRIKRISAIAALVVAIAVMVAFPFFREWQIEAQARDRQVGADVAYGNGAVKKGELLDSLPYFAEAVALDQGKPAREVLHRARMASVLAQCPRITQMLFLTNEVRVASLSPDGRYILTAEQEGKAQIFDSQTGRLVVPKFGQQNGILWASYSPDGNLVATAGADSTACIWAASNGVPIKCMPHPDQVWSVSFSPDGGHLLTGCNDGIARIWSTADWQLERALTGHVAAVVCAIYSHDGRVIATGSYDKTAKLWDATTGSELGSLPNLSWVHSVAFSPDDRLIATGCDDRKARVWTVPNEEPVLPNLLHADVVMGVDFSPDGRFVITACLDGTVRIWSSGDHQPAKPNAVLPHSDRVNTSSFARDGHRIVTACLDGTVRMWDLAGTTPQPSMVAGVLSEDKSRFVTLTNNCLQVWDTLSDAAVSPLIQPRHSVRETSLSPDGRFLLTLSAAPEFANGSTYILETWQANTGRRIGRELRTTNSLTNISMSRDGRRLLMCNGPVVEVWDISSGTVLTRKVTGGQPWESASFSPNGESVVSWVTNDVSLLIWDAVNGKEVSALKHDFPIHASVFDRDGLRLVVCCADTGLSHCYAQVWDASSGTPVGSRLSHGDGVLCGSFSRDGNRVVTGGEDFKAQIWATTTGARVVFVTHENKVNGVGFSPDGAWFATASSDTTACVWSSETGDLVTPPLRHHTRLKEVKFLADNRSLVTSDEAGRAWIWKIPSTDKPVQELLKFSHLLAGRTSTSSGGLNSSDTATLHESWNRFRATQNPLSADSNDTVAGWYEFQAEEAELAGQWPAAIFHLQNLLQMSPDDSSIAKRLADAEARLGKLKTTSAP